MNTTAACLSTTYFSCVVEAQNSNNLFHYYAYIKYESNFIFYLILNE